MNNHKPPKFLLWFFRWYCHRDYLEDIEGDLLERFEIRAEKKGVKSAKWWFTKDVIRLFRPGIIRPLFSNQRFNQLGMFKNYFTIATRSLLKQKLYSTINIGGLTVGLTCFIMIFIYVHHELSYDNFHPNKDNIYRVYQRQVGNNFMGSEYFTVTPAGLASALVSEFPEVKSATSIVERSVLLAANNSSFFESGLWTDHEFFNIFNYDLVKGNQQKVFEQPMSIVLTESFASKLFGDSSVLGHSVLVSSNYGDEEYIVSGVIKDLPDNSSFQFNYIINLQSNAEYLKAAESSIWRNSSYQTFFLIDQYADPIGLENKLSSLFNKHSSTDQNNELQDEYYVQPLYELHLANNMNFDIGLKGSTQYLILFSAIAIIVLVLACVNYMNLAIARSIQRAKEVGLRKAVGALRSQIIGQFLSESIFIAFMALVLALGIAYWLTPHFGIIIERPLSLDLISNPILLPILAGLILAVGIFSGSYPAVFMSSLKPINTLKGKTTNHYSKMTLQSILVVIQYAASIVLIISSIVIYLQFDFIQNKELGYDKDHIIVVKTRSSELRRNIASIKTALLLQSNILNISTSNSLPSSIGSSTSIRLNKEDTEDNAITIYNNSIDPDYLKIFGIALKYGRDFEPDTDTKKDVVIINESAVKSLGWKQGEAIGNHFYQGKREITVIGVVKDFHMFSMHLGIKPLMLTYRNDRFNYAAIKVNPDNIQNTIATIEDIVQKHSNYPFEFHFMDTEFDKLYKADIRLGKIFGVFTLLAIFIASLGLFGLAAYNTKQRTKEIGIRKVLGASVQTIMGLIAQEFLKMVLVGLLIAVPTAWLMMNVWLQEYAYRIELEWWIFAIAAVLACIVSLLTISSQTIKASITNPVDSLRSE